MLMKICKKAGGTRSVWLGLLCLAGYLTVGTTIAWMTYGDSAMTMDRELWGTCFVLGLAGTAAWIVLVDGLAPLLAKGFIATAMGLRHIGLFLLVFALIALLLTAIEGVIMTGPSPSASEVLNFMVTEFPEAYILPSIITMFLIGRMDWEAIFQA